MCVQLGCFAEEPKMGGETKRHPQTPLTYTLRKICFLETRAVHECPRARRIQEKKADKKRLLEMM